MELGLLNPLKPASGVVLKYLGGNSCPPFSSSSSSSSSSTDKNSGGGNGGGNSGSGGSGGGDYEVPCAKSFKININCHNEIDEIPDTVEVTESTLPSMSILHLLTHPLTCHIISPLVHSSTATTRLTRYLTLWR